jgi:hypothetical protein
MMEPMEAGHLLRIIDLYLREAPPRLEAAWAAGRRRDARSVAVAAHTLGCLAGNVGAGGVMDAARSLEAAAETGSGGAGRIPVLLYDLEIAHAEARIRLMEARRALGPA